MDIFSSSGPSNLSVFTQGFIPRISEEINSHLTSNITHVEIKRAVFDIHPSKAPGENGLIPLVFQHYWNVIG